MTEAINYAIITIGKRKNEKGEPLVEAGGLVLGSVPWLQELLADFARMQPCTCRSV